ncbi:M23 family metallopeptidase [Streptomyces sp. NBC_01485]|uniref:M23 family metallopeptidase n=1 Tax=Streptomyces sp. NBC_01485 TaxID=2903884 RepID=UPI002E2EE465|nr:M23 family metallopeptidase [Streptomyces sp. NBC_01485]
MYAKYAKRYLHAQRRLGGLALLLSITLITLITLTAILTSVAWADPQAPPRALTPPPSPSSSVSPVPAIGRAWPVGTRPAVVRGWEPPATAYARGHRGVDLAAPPGAPVRSVAAGRVSFAGRVAGRGVVSVELTATGLPPLRTTYEPVRASVRKGDEVAPGQIVGTVEGMGGHCAGTCVHWGLLRGEAYLDPLSLLPPWLLRRGPSRLLPVLGVPLPLPVSLP